MCTKSRRARATRLPPSSLENMTLLALTKPANFPLRGPKDALAVPRGALPYTHARAPLCVMHEQSCTPGGEVHMPHDMPHATCTCTCPHIYHIQGCTIPRHFSSIWDNTQFNFIFCINTHYIYTPGGHGLRRGSVADLLAQGHMWSVGCCGCSVFL